MIKPSKTQGVNEMKQTMGEKIAELRKEKNMTQKDLAEQMNVTDKAVSKWERNLACPDINSIPRLAEVLEISADELLQVSGNQKQEKPEWEKILEIALRAVPLAMGVAVVVTSILGELEFTGAVNMLGIGMICLAAAMLKK